jgi:hypothetical protein
MSVNVGKGNMQLFMGISMGIIENETECGKRE